MDLVHISVEQAAITVALGMGVVFLGLILLMWVVRLMSKIIIRQQAKAAKKQEAAEKRAAAEKLADSDAAGPKVAPAPGTAGELRLYDTDPRDAAMIMAIVANASGKPLNELRFRSIREVKEGQNVETQ